MKIFKLLLTFFLLFLLSSCATNKNTLKNNVGDLIFEKEIADFEENITNHDTDKLWTKYLISSQINNTQSSQDEFEKIKSDYDSGKLGCKDINFFKLIHNNYWSLKPHQLAMDCYTKLQDFENATKQQDIITKILQWSFSTGNGNHIKTPIQTTTAGDAQDIIELSGYSIIDQYIIPFAGFQSMRYAFIVLDNESLKQKTLFFSNDEFMFSLFGEDYKQASYNTLSIVSSLAKQNSNPAFKNGLGNIFISIENYEQAEKWFIQSAESGSVYANTQLASLCLTRKLSNNSIDNCLSHLMFAAKLQYADSFLYLSALYLEGVGVDKDQATAKRFMTLAKRKLGDGIALKKLADLYKRGVFGENLKKKALGYYQQAVEYNNADAAYYLYSYYKKINPDKTKFYLDKAINLKSPFAYSIKGYEYLYSKLKNKKMVALLKSNKQFKAILIKFKEIISKGVKRKDPLSYYIMGSLYSDKSFGDYFYNKKTAFNYFLKGAKAWQPASLSELSDYLIYSPEFNNGISTTERKKNYRYALKWAVRGAKLGNAKCALNSGYLLEGRAYNDPAEAAKYYLIAAKKGLSYGQSNYGALLRKGKGIKKNLIEAKFWLLKATEKKNPFALNELGLLYEDQGNLEEAVKMFKKAIKYHYSYAYYNIARFYEKGLWFKKDIQIAKKWYLKAANYGHPSAKSIADTL